MDITIKIIRSVAVTNLLILSLVSCSSSPSPWAQAEKDPWAAKNEAGSQSASSDQAVSSTSLNDPVLLSDPEPMRLSDPEPIVMQQPEAAPVPEVIAPVVVVDDLTSEQEIMAMLSSNYAVQAYAGATLESVEKFRRRKDLNDLLIVKTERSGAIVYVLVDVYPERSAANAAAVDIEAKIGSKPWVRSLAGLQKIVVQ